MSDVAYTSKIRIEREQGPARLAYLPSETEPVKFGFHGAVAEQKRQLPRRRRF